MEKQILKLSDMLSGEQAEIVSFEDENHGLERLGDMGLYVGTQLRIIKFAPLGDPIQIKARGFYLSIRKSLASKIVVKRK